MREMVYELRRNGLVCVLKALIMFLVCLSIYNIHSFNQDTDRAIKRDFTPQSDYNMYTVIDTLADPDLFSAYRESRSRIAAVAEFYDQLNADSTLSAVPVFDQPVPVIDFRGDATFENAYGTELSSQGFYEDEWGRQVLDVKSVQMNQKAFDFYGLRTQDDVALRWDDVDYASGSVPVLLGSEFAEYYSVGDTFSGWLYGDLEFEVAGFLEPSTSIYYKGEPNFYLDRYILVPYPPRLNECSGLALDSCGILAFAMINGDIVAPAAIESGEVFERLNAIADRSGFTDFTLLNTPAFLMQLGFMRQLIEANRGLLFVLELSITASAGVVLVLLNRFLSARRSAKTRIWSLLGEDDHRIVARHRRFWVFEYSCALIALIAITSIVPNSDYLAQLLAGAILLGIALIDAAVQRGMVLRVLRSAREAK